MDLTFNPQEHTYRLGSEGTNIPGVTSALQEFGIIDYSFVNAEALKRSSKLGTAVHKATALYDLNNLVEATLSPVIRPYLDGWIKFRQETGFVPEIIEAPMYSKKYRVAGTPDRIGKFDGKLSVLDIKSGSSILRGTAIQTAGYAVIYNEGEKIGYRIKRRFAVRLLSDGTYRLQEFKNKGDIAVFMAALTLFNWKRR